MKHLILCLGLPVLQLLKLFSTFNPGNVSSLSTMIKLRSYVINTNGMEKIKCQRRLSNAVVVICLTTSQCYTNYLPNKGKSNIIIFRIILVSK